MKKILSIMLALTLAVTMMTGCKGEEKNAASGTYADLIQAYVDAIDLEYAYGIAETLAYDESMAGACGFRTAGSDYEHACADYLVSEMEKLGLEDIEKIPVTVDKWQFDSSSLTIEGTDISLQPASYAQNGTDESGITAELVDIGTGTAADYEGLDVEGKIVLAAIDQRNEAWIDGYLQEADLHGAAALVVYDIDGYATFSDDIRNIQDVCTDDMMPTVSCSITEAEAIKAAMAEGHSTCTLKVDNTMAPGQGTSYTVIGKIKGKSDVQQMIYSGHYDKYFYGMQDDCSAIACIFSVAKAMKDSAYIPENDIVIVCHGAEEWGASGTQFDWATGSWETINTAKPDWAGKTLAMFNFELCAYMENGATAGRLSGVPEFGAFADSFVNSYGSIIDCGAYKDGILSEVKPAQTMEDGVCYRFAGVPYLLNGVDFSGDETFSEQKYHSEADDSSTWDENVMKLNVGWFGGMGILMDQQPALQLDISALSAWLDSTLDEELAAEAGCDLTEYKAAAEELAAAADEISKSAAQINAAYEEAFSSGDEAAMNELRAKGIELNRSILQAFKLSQKGCLGIEAASNIVTKHEGYGNTLNLLKGAADACAEGSDWNEDETGALDMLWQVNAAIAYDAILFSKENYEKTDAYYDREQNKFWGNDVVIDFADINDAIVAIDQEGDFGRAGEIIANARVEVLEGLKEAIGTETETMKEMVTVLLGALE